MNLSKAVHQGFTLIEILIVLVIMGITVSFAIIAFGDFGAGRRIEFAAEQFANTLKLAQQQAILLGSTLGMRVDNQGYQIMMFHPPSEWSIISNKGVFRFHPFPRKTWVKLKTNSSVSQITPPIIINASGDTTPLTLNFGTNKDTTIIILIIRRDGSMNFKRPR
jgi:general secretion pathway protein H